MSDKDKYHHLKRRYLKLKLNQSAGDSPKEYNPSTELQHNSISIDELYKDLATYISIDYTGEYNDRTMTYGEMTETGVKQMLEEINTDNKVFYDLGCGYGRVLIHALRNHNFAKVVGVEIVPNRYDVAKMAVSRLSEHYRNRIELVKGDMLQQNIYDADVIWMSNLCLESNLQKKVSKKIGDEVRTGTVIFVSVKLEHPKLRVIKEISVEMTWSDKSNIYQYVKM